MSIAKISGFVFRGVEFRFKTPLIVFIEGHLAYNDELGLSIVYYESMEGQLERDVNGQLCMLWEEFALCPDEKLSKSGLELKKKLIEMVV